MTYRGVFAAILALLVAAPSVRAVAPGTGVRVAFDDFEDENWGYQFNNPKASHELDEQTRMPAGRATNGKWGEGLLRGHPDVIRRVATPEGGLFGSTGALLLSSKESGFPGRITRKSQQDDLIMVVRSNYGKTFPVSMTPSVTARVYLPPRSEWEGRSGSMFAFRAEVQSISRVAKKKGKGLFARMVDPEPEDSWPGIFFQYDARKDECFFILRGNERGDLRGPVVEQEGWWTLGMTFTPDGRCHYYARPGVGDLDEGDIIASHYPYNHRCLQLNTLFFDTFNMDDGRTWSTPVIVDDPAIFLARPDGGSVASRGRSRR